MSQPDRHYATSNGKPLNCDPDAQRWAREFMALIENKSFTFIDEGLMIAWFANAIMCGSDTYRWKQEERAKSETPTINAGDQAGAQDTGSSPGDPAPNKLWLWKNFVDGRPEYWAFDNAYPCRENGDPITLGEPCGYAIVKQSIKGRDDVSEEQVIRAIKGAKSVPSSASLGASTVRDLRAWVISDPDLRELVQHAADVIEVLSSRSATSLRSDVLEEAAKACVWWMSGSVRLDVALEPAYERGCRDSAARIRNLTSEADSASDSR